MHKIWDSEKTHAAVAQLSKSLLEAEPDLQLSIMQETGVVHPESLAENFGTLRTRMMSQQRSLFILMSAVDALFQLLVDHLPEEKERQEIFNFLEARMVDATIMFADEIRRAAAERKKKVSNIVLPGAMLPPNIRGQNGGRAHGG